MIVWIKKEASERPNDQRAKIITINPNERSFTAQFCGDPKPCDTFTFSLSDIHSVELKGVKVKKNKHRRDKIQMILSKKK